MTAARNEPLTPEEEEAARVGGAGWCGEDTFARLFATLDAARTALEAMRRERDEADADFAAVIRFVEGFGIHGSEDAAEAVTCLANTLTDRAEKAEAERAGAVAMCEEVTEQRNKNLRDLRDVEAERHRLREALRDCEADRVQLLGDGFFDDNISERVRDLLGAPGATSG